MPRRKKTRAVPRGGFFHVRSATGARHEYDIPARLLTAHPERYVLLDPNPVPKARPAVIVTAAPAPVTEAAREGDSEEEPSQI